jgi:DNA-directed RNA polymerase specialized sigma24 family protein
VDRDEAEDAIQDAFLRLCLAERQQRVRNAAAFLTGIVKRVRVEFWHQTQRHQQRFVAERVEELELSDTAPQPADYIQADQRLERCGIVSRN